MKPMLVRIEKHVMGGGEVVYRPMLKDRLPNSEILFKADRDEHGNGYPRHPFGLFMVQDDVAEDADHIRADDPHAAALKAGMSHEHASEFAVAHRAFLAR